MCATRLARQISDSHVGPNGYIPLVTLSPEWEAAFAESLTGPPEDRQLAMAPSKLQAFMQALRGAFDAAAATGEAPVLLTSGGIRAHVRAIVERIRPNTPVLAQAEIFSACADPHSRDDMRTAARAGSIRHQQRPARSGAEIVGVSRPAGKSFMWRAGETVGQAKTTPFPLWEGSGAACSQMLSGAGRTAPTSGGGGSHPPVLPYDA